MITLRAVVDVIAGQDGVVRVGVNARLAARIGALLDHRSSDAIRAIELHIEEGAKRGLFTIEYADPPRQTHMKAVYLATYQQELPAVGADADTVREFFQLQWTLSRAQVARLLQAVVDLSDNQEQLLAALLAAEAKGAEPQSCGNCEVLAHQVAELSEKIDALTAQHTRHIVAKNRELADAATALNRLRDELQHLRVENTDLRQSRTWVLEITPVQEPEPQAEPPAPSPAPRQSRRWTRRKPDKER